MWQQQAVPQTFLERLGAGETIMWWGMPNKRSYVLRGSWYLVPFSIMWGGFAIFWEVSVIRSGAPLFFWLWGIPFVLVGLYIMVGRFWVAGREAENAKYAVTNERILIEHGAFRRKFSELYLTGLPALNLEEHSNGIGTIFFGVQQAYDSLAGGWPGSKAATPAFHCVQHAREIYKIIQDARRQAAPAASRF